MKDTNNYDRLAPYYDKLAAMVYLGAVRQAQRSLLHLIPANGNILFIGGGTGKILDELLETCRPANVFYVEKSSRMLSLSQKNCRHAKVNRVHFVHGTEDNLADRHFDVVITQFFFD